MLYFYLLLAQSTFRQFQGYGDEDRSTIQTGGDNDSHSEEMGDRGDDTTTDET